MSDLSLLLGGNLKTLPLDQFKKYDFDPDKYIVRQLEYHITNLIKSPKFVITGSRRINDINKTVVKAIRDELFYNADLENTKILNSNGYGDIEINYEFTFDNGKKVYPKTKTYYLEINCTTKDIRNLKKGRNGYRYLYLSNMENITKHASHILIIIQFDQNTLKNTFIGKGFKLFDLSKIPFKVKIEYNCSLDDIMKTGELIK